MRAIFIAPCAALLFATSPAPSQEPASIDPATARCTALIEQRLRPRMELLDPELQALVRSLPRGGPERSAATMPTVRANFNAWLAERARTFPAPPADVTRSEIQIPGPSGAPSIRALIYRPREGAGLRPALLDIHGGSYVLGIPEMNELRNRRLSSDLDMLVVSIDYRLAPEHPFPAAVEDAHAALAWLHENARQLGIDPARISVSGDSAGGAIATGLALRIRDEARYPIARLTLIYPSISDQLLADLPVECARVAAARPNFARSAYLGAQGNDSPYAVPARAASFAGLPPVFLAVGALDVLSDSNLLFARRLIRDGVPTELHVYPGAIHGFDMAFDARVSRRFYADLREAMEGTTR